MIFCPTSKEKWGRKESGFGRRQFEVVILNRLQSSEDKPKQMSEPSVPPPHEVPLEPPTRLEAFVVRLGNLVSWLFVVMMAMITYEVVARYVFNAPTFWAHESTVALGGFAFIFGGAYCMADRSHMRITVLTDRFGARGLWWSDVLSTFVAVVYLSGLTFATARMTQRSLFKFAADGTWTPERSGSYWNPPIPGFINLSLCLGSALFLLVVVLQFVLLFQRRTPEATPEPKPGS